MNSAWGSRNVTFFRRGLSAVGWRTPLVFLLMGTMVAWGSSGTGADVHFIRIDGSSLTGAWLGSPDGHTLDIRATGGSKRIRLDNLAKITFRTPRPSSKVTSRATDRQESPAADQQGQAVFYLADGGRLFGTLIEPRESSDSVMGRTAIGDPTEFPFDRLAGVQLAEASVYPRAHEAFLSALSAQRPGEDILITNGRVENPETVGTEKTEKPATKQSPKSLPGRLISLGPESGSFVFSDRTRSFQTQRVYGIVLAAGASAGADHEADRQYPVTVELTDGSTFTGRIERADQSSVRVATSLNMSIDLDLVDIATLKIESDRVVYVSDLKPIDQETEGILHRPWPVQYEKSVAGTPLSLDGQVYQRGLGVHSRTELAFDIDRAFEMLVAVIGIDDSVRPRGNVVFRVVGDGLILFDSGAVTGKDKPKDIRVDMTDVKVLRLIVDYGEGLDLADHANWADVRLLKPAPPIDATTN